MKISIIVPVYNVESYLRRCLDSLVAQDLSSDEYEIILIDDGSTDNSLFICNEYASNHQNIVVYTQDNAGASAARNRGLEYAKGDYLFFVDSDDYIAHNVLRELYSKAKDNCCDILFFNFTVITENGKQLHKTFSDFKRDQQYCGDFLAINTNDFGSMWKGIYRRSFIQKHSLQFTNGIIHEDTDFNYSAYPLAKTIMITDKNVYYYRNFGESLTRTKDIKKQQLLVYSDFVVVENIVRFLKLSELSDGLRKHYKQLSSSILVSSFFNLYSNHELYGIDFIQKCINFSFDKKLLPIKGKTNSWKSTLLVPIVNAVTSLYHRRQR